MITKLTGQLVAVKVQAYSEGEDLTTLPDPVPGRLLLISLVNPAAAPVVYQFQNGPGGAIGYLPDSVALTTVGGALYAHYKLDAAGIAKKAKSFLATAGRR